MRSREEVYLRGVRKLYTYNIEKLWVQHGRHVRFIDVIDTMISVCILLDVCELLDIHDIDFSQLSLIQTAVNYLNDNFKGYFDDSTNDRLRDFGNRR